VIINIRHKNAVGQGVLAGGGLEQIAPLCLPLGALTQTHRHTDKKVISKTYFFSFKKENMEFWWGGSLRKRRV
jgi:hypothetical protein